jgi:type IV secretory pathway VirJ component
VTRLRAILALALAGVILLIESSAIKAPDAMRPGTPVWTPITEQQLSHGRFENFTVYVPHASAKGFVLLLSGSDGWSPNLQDIATRLAADCVFPDGDLENLSHFVQAYFQLPTYLSPILAGYGEGATLAYATLVQAPANTFAGAVSVEFCPSYALSKPLCKGSGVEFTSHPDGKGVDFLPSKQPGNAWTVVQSGSPAACSVESVTKFVAQVPGAQLVLAPQAGSASASTATAPSAWTAQIGAAVDALMASHPAAPLATVPSSLSDLPLVTVPPQSGGTVSDTFAIILSGDGGWAGLDKDVAAALAATGIPVIGLDSLRYFWSARTPEGLAHDIDRITQYYLKKLGKERVLLIGYSQGADVLPFAVNHLSDATRAHVALTAVMGMSEHALFEFHMTSWVSDDNSGPATLPEVDKIRGIPVLCIYGEDETDTLCPKLDPHKTTIVKLKGGHHFDGDYANLARIILAAAKPR